MRRVAWILIVVVIAALAAYLATRTDGPRTAAPAPEASGAGNEGERATVAPSEDGLVSDRAALLPAGAAGAPDDGRTSGWRVCVVDAGTREPVAGAIVSVRDIARDFHETIARGIGFDTIEGLRVRRELAVEARTGADGCVLFASPPERASFEARRGSDWAFAVVNQPPPDGCVTLELAPDRELRVRVADAGGAPVGGVPVAVRLETVSPAYTFKWTDTEPGSGIATFLHFQRRLEQGSGWHVVLAFPTLDSRSIPVDERTPSEPPLELVLGDTGSALVRLRATDGGVPELANLELRLEAFAGEVGGEPLWPDGPWSTPRLDATGNAPVPWLGLGLALRVHVLLDEAEVACETFAGPTRSGEEVLCEIVWLAPRFPFVTGRFVLSDGTPWPATTVLAEPAVFPSPERPLGMRELLVDAAGRFRLRVDAALPERGTRAYRFRGQHPERPGEVSALVPLQQPIPPEGLELGDVTLDHGILLAAGRVVDEERRPVAGAVVHVRARAIVAGRERWPGVPAAGRQRTAEDGVFELFAPLGEPASHETLRLHASARDHVAESTLDVAVGARDAEIVLAGAGAIAGSLALRDGIANEDLVIWLHGDRREPVFPRDDATFEATSLLPGAYALEVRWRDDGRAERGVAARVDGLLVRAGETCRDPRIQGLAIESALETLRIRVVDRAATPLARAAISIVGAAAGTALTGNDGIAFVRCERLPVDLEVSAFGFARQRLAGVGSDREVVLDPGHPIRLRTRARAIGAEPRYTLYAWLHEVRGEAARGRLAWGRELDPDALRFDERGELALRVPAAGVYECELSVSVLRPDRVGAGGRVELEPAPRIDVRALAEEQVFDLAIPQSAIDAAVEAALR